MSKLANLSKILDKFFFDLIFLTIIQYTFSQYYSNIYFPNINDSIFMYFFHFYIHVPPNLECLIAGLEVMSGLPSIRAFDLTDHFGARCERVVDVNNAVAENFSASKCEFRRTPSD